MKLSEIKIKTACDMPGCRNRAKFRFSLGESKRYSLELCADCALGICEAMNDATAPRTEEDRNDL